LPPFLEAVGSDADEVGGAVLIEHRIIVVCGDRLGLELEEGCRDLVTLGRRDGNGRGDGNRLRRNKGSLFKRELNTFCHLGSIYWICCSLYQRDFLDRLELLLHLRDVYFSSFGVDLDSTVTPGLTARL
jgi:hypothetical protein